MTEHQRAYGSDRCRRLPLGTVDKVEAHHIKLTMADSGSHSDHHHYLSGGLVTEVEGNLVRLSANADDAALLEEKEAGEAIADLKKPM